MATDWVSGRADSISKMAKPRRDCRFSSRGPVHDGRIKPDIVAPERMSIGRSRSTIRRAGSSRSDTRYMFDGGTSMARVVAGCVAVTRAFY